MRVLSIRVTEHEYEDLKWSSEIVKSGDEKLISLLLRYIKEDCILGLRGGDDGQKALELDIPIAHIEAEKRNKSKRLRVVGKLECEDELFTALPEYVKLFTGDTVTGEFISDMVANRLVTLAKVHRCHMDAVYGLNIRLGCVESEKDKELSKKYREFVSELYRGRGDRLPLKVRVKIREARKAFILSRLKEDAPFVFEVADNADWKYVYNCANKLSQSFNFEENTANPLLIKGLWAEILKCCAIDGKIPA